MKVIGIFNFTIVWTLLTVLALSAARKDENKNSTKVNVDKLDDVPAPDYGDNPCSRFEREIPDFRAPGRRISEVKCFEYVWSMKREQQEIKRFIECLILKRRRNLVAGGSDAEAGHYAHMAAIGWLSTEGKWVFKCGASLISEKFLLTAAHCSRVSNADSSVRDPAPKIVRLGGHSIADYDFDGIRALDMEIKRFIRHPEYRPPRKYNDIALIELVSEVSFEWMTHPACLGTSMELESNAPVTVTGWGVVDIATLRTSPILQVATINLMASNECDTRLRFGRNRNWNGIVDHQLCAGYMAGGIDTCMGDSGGPIQVKLNITNPIPELYPWYIHRVLGVTSFGYGCARANTPGVYTRVASFIDWIEYNVWPNQTVPKQS